MKKFLPIIGIFSLVLLSFLFFQFFSSEENKGNNSNKDIEKNLDNNIISENFPSSITISDIAQNPEGIEFNTKDNTFLLSSLNAGPIIKVHLDGSFEAFTKGERFPLSTAGLQIDYKRNRLLVAGFNGTELMDNDEKTKGTSFLRIYNLDTGEIQKEVNLSSLLPEAQSYFANDIVVDKNGNAYITDWYAKAIYKVDTDGKASVFWENTTSISSGPNGIDFHKDGYLLASILTVDGKGLYANFGLVKIPVNNPDNAKIVNISDEKFSGFDGMVINKSGNVVGVTNDGKTPGGNTLIELSSIDNWESAQSIHSVSIPASTTVALTPSNDYYIILQDFSDSFKKNWTIKKIDLY